MYFATSRDGRVVAVFVGDELEAAVAFADAYANVPGGVPLAIVVSDRLSGRVYANAAFRSPTWISPARTCAPTTEEVSDG